MKTTLYAFMLALIAGCVSFPVTKGQWDECVYQCERHGELVEACNELLAGPGCKCKGGIVIWLDELEEAKW